MHEELIEQTQATNGYHKVLTNLYIENEHGEFFKLDAVILHETGIYVVKLEEHKGDVYGDEKEKKWLQTLYKGRNDTYFPNPIQVNRELMRLLQRKTEVFPSTHFQSLVVFDENCDLKDVKIYSPHTHVIKEKDVTEYLHNRLYTTGILYNPVQIDTIYQFLFPFTQVSKKIKKTYEKYQDKIQKREESPSIYRPKKSKAKWLWLTVGLFLLVAIGVSYWLLG